MRTTRLLSLLAAAVLGLTAAAGTATASVFHTVRRGDTLTSIAATDGLSVAQLAAANGLSASAPLSVGRNLVIPARGAVATTPAQSASVASGSTPTTEIATRSGGVVVTRGETLSGLAAQYGTSVAALAAANGISPDGLLLAGRTLTIPDDAAASTEPVTTTPNASGSAAEPVFVSPAQVGEIAAQDDVSPALAEAIADQESGFNDNEVSRTGATGVMQIEPSTWRQLNRSGLDLSSSSATDNVRGGVALLHDLLAQTGGDETEAVAAYYQGLQSVRERGLYPSTRRYVHSVLALQGRY